MINVTKISVGNLDLDHLDIFWEIDKVPASSDDLSKHEIFNYDFYVLRSGDSAMGPFEQIAGPFRDQYMLRDVQVSLLHKWRQYFYKIKVVDRRTQASKEFGPQASSSAPIDLIGAEIIRQEDVLFREFIGRKCWLFKKRTFGPLCTCYDLTLQRRTRSGHALCFDTGFLGGYMAPIEVYIQIDPAGTNRQATSVGEIQPGDTSARMISFPPVSPGDILVESENHRWRVISMSPTERLRAAIRQELKLHEIPRGDIEYALPVNVDVQNLTPAAPRNFSNPQNLESNADYADILAAWDYRRGPV
jgi:hypothetical protein